MLDKFCLNDFCTKGFANCLMSKTNSKNRNLSCKIFYCSNADSGASWIAWAW